MSNIFTEINDRKSSSSSSGSPLSPKHAKPPKKQNPISPARRRAQRRANNSSPRRKAEVEKASNETMEEFTKNKTANEANENDDSKKVEKLAIQNDPRHEKGSAKNESVIQETKTEKTSQQGEGMRRWWGEESVHYQLLRLKLRLKEFKHCQRHNGPHCC